MLLGSNYRNDAVEKLYGDRIGDSSIIFTPWDTVENMLDLIPEDFWTPDVTILDMYCKSGRFLVGAFRKLYNSPYLAYLSESERTLHILNKQLFGLCADMTCMLLSEANLYGHAQYGKKHIKLVDTYDYNSVVKQRKDGIINRTLEGKFGQMKFDLVIGNPPYNKDAYIDFVEIGHKLATQYSCWVTPAKWQAKADKKNDMFRKAIVPYMSKIVMARSGHDIFDVDENAGISYYLITSKDKHAVKEIKNICNFNETLRSDFEEHDELSPVLYNRKILQLIGKVGTLGEGFKQSLYVKNTDNGESCIAGTLGFSLSTFCHMNDRGESVADSDYVEVMQGEKVVGYKKKSGLYTLSNLGKYKCTCCCMMGYSAMFSGKDKVLGSPFINIIGPNQIPKGSFLVLKYFDTREEAEYFRSYINSKFASFLFFIGICGASINKEFFRFIPDPVKYDHIFTDEELYKKYKLTQDEINIIESVIKERK